MVKGKQSATGQDQRVLAAIKGSEEKGERKIGDEEVWGIAEKLP